MFGCIACKSDFSSLEANFSKKVIQKNMINIL